METKENKEKLRLPSDQKQFKQCELNSDEITSIRKYQIIGYLFGFIAIVAVSVVKRNSLRTDMFFVSYVLKPLILFGLFYVLVNIFNHIRTKFSKNVILIYINKHSLFIYKIVNFIAAFIFTYYFVSVVLIYAGILK